MTSFDCDSCNMAELLTMMVEDTGLKWEIIGDQYIISKATKPPIKKVKPTISGFVSNAKTGKSLPNVNIYLKNTFTGAVSDFNGYFSITNIVPGIYTVVASIIGFEKSYRMIEVSEDVIVDFPLASSVIDMSALEVFASRAVPEETPVAFTDVDKAEINFRLGSRDIPMVLEQAPSVFTSYMGGGSGDSRLNVRGFDQSDMAILINGVPVNDMEHGYAKWSIWEGIGDITSSIQLQRGLSADNLAIPYVGGTLNIITDHPQRMFGGKYKREVGSDGYQKYVLSVSSGVIKDRFSLTTTLAHKTRDGFIENTWIDAWTYYLSMSYTPSSRHRLDFFALGAPLRRGENPFRRSIASYDHEYARELGIDDGIIDTTQELGYRYNATWGIVDKDYTGKQYWIDGLHKRRRPGILYEREHYYNKPHYNLNWYYKINKDIDLSTVFYFQEGLDIQAQPFGTLLRTADGHVDWDATIAENISPEHYSDVYGHISTGIIYNKVHHQYTQGAISKLVYRYNDDIKLSGGIDWRYAWVKKYGEIRDLLGGEYYDETVQYSTVGDEGEKINYDFKYWVDWISTYGQVNYGRGPVNSYGSIGITRADYALENKGHEINPLPINGSAIRGGVSYHIGNGLVLFSNVGYISKIPIIEQIIDDYYFKYNRDFKIEKITSIEVGIFTSGNEGRFTTRSSAYYTIWENHTHIVGNTDDLGVWYNFSLPEVGAVHTGIELEAFYQPFNRFYVNGILSIGNWEWGKDISAKVRYQIDTDSSSVGTYYINNLKIGDVPQTQLKISGTFFPVPGSMLSIVYKYNNNYYAKFDPRGRTDQEDRQPSWKLPSYSVIDFHATYKLPFFDNRIEIKANIFNLLDTRYISDATDNYFRYESDGFGHKAENAGVFFGLPRTYNLGFVLSY